MQDYLTDLGITSALGAVPGVAAHLYTRTPLVQSSIFNSADTAARDKLLKVIRRMGIDKVESPIGPAMAPAINGGKQKLLLPKGSKPSAGVLSHELGHALNMRAAKKLAGKKGAIAHMLGVGPLFMAAGAPASIAHLFGADTDTLGALGAGGVALSMPRLAEETLASVRGARLMKRLKLKGRWKAFVGLPTYAMHSVLPAIPWLSRKLQEKFN
jgi:hypothetical protein